MNKIITWQKVNLRIHTFSYGNLETGNKPCPLTIERVKGDNVISQKQSVHLKMCAAQIFRDIYWSNNRGFDTKKEDQFAVYRILRKLVGIVTDQRCLYFKELYPPSQY